MKETTPNYSETHWKVGYTVTGADREEPGVRWEYSEADANATVMRLINAGLRPDSIQPPARDGKPAITISLAKSKEGAR